MPSFKKSPPELVARFGRVAAQVPGAARKQMFGYPVCVVSGNMFMGLHEDYLFLRLAAPERAGLIERLVARLFEPMPGRPMTEYVVIPAEIIEGPTIDDWVQRSFASAQTLPPKTPKTPKTERIVMAHAEKTVMINQPPTSSGVAACSTSPKRQGTGRAPSTARL